MLISRQGSRNVRLTCRLHLANFKVVSVAVADKYFVRVFLISLLSQLNNRISASFSCSYLHTPPLCPSAAVILLLLLLFLLLLSRGGRQQSDRCSSIVRGERLQLLAALPWTLEMRQMCVKHPWSWGAPPIGVLIVVCKFLRIHKILTNTILKDANWVQLLLLLPLLLLLVLLLLQLSGDWCVQAPATDTQCLHKP